MNINLFLFMKNWYLKIHLSDSRSSKMYGISADDAIDAGVPNTGFTLLQLVVGPRQAPVACSPQGW